MSVLHWRECYPALLLALLVVPALELLGVPAAALLVVLALALLGVPAAGAGLHDDRGVNAASAAAAGARGVVECSGC
eukprot:476856-Pelagomonas_calceolata.AAC.2